MPETGKSDEVIVLLRMTHIFVGDAVANIFIDKHGLINMDV